jgi:hypothetical protein
VADTRAVAEADISVEVEALTLRAHRLQRAVEARPRIMEILQRVGREIQRTRRAAGTGGVHRTARRMRLKKLQRNWRHTM